MNLNFAADFLADLNNQLTTKKTLTLSGAGNLSAKVILLKNLLVNMPRSVLWIVNDLSEARALAEHLNFWQEQPVRILQLEQTDEPERERSLRLMHLAKELQDFQGYAVIVFRETQINLPALAKIAENALAIKVGTTYRQMDLVNDLVDQGYESLPEEQEFGPGFFQLKGNLLIIWPVQATAAVTLEFEDNQIAQIWSANRQQTFSEVKFSALELDFPQQSLLATIGPETLVVADELMTEESAEILGQDYPKPADFFQKVLQPVLIFTSFPEPGVKFQHLRFLSVLKFVTPDDLLEDLRRKKQNGWQVLLLTKQATELKNIFLAHNFLFGPEFKVELQELAKDDFLPQALQNPDYKIAVLTDREIFGFRQSGSKGNEQKVYLDFITSLKSGDFVVHLDHGIGVFRGIEEKTLDEVKREYLRLDYAAQDKLFVPIDQADKVNRFIGTADKPPRLTRLGSSEWATVQKRVAGEAKKVAQELLDLYARRSMAVGHNFQADGPRQIEFERNFPYEETPGQLRAILDVKKDMEAAKPMDRLVCGDVGFGKTEVALRAAFKAALAGKQVAFISPITILTDQHYKSFKKRLAGFDITCEMLSRFRTKLEQQKILAGLASGAIQIIIGTHRLLQPDICFKNLGLVIIDEEQRFGVKQKEKLKRLRAQVDILTMTATPIPRTLNLALNKLRDISTITTPPPGRLPIITEVRHFSLPLIREAILLELQRKGQVYFLHNRVATIESIAERLRGIVPEARFVVTHGQLPTAELEDRILNFKNGEFDVLVSSAIIENGIDLPNANTLIVNDAENFGLAQLYQLRGRVGRSRTQAYTYFLYNTQQLKLDAKKRLRAIVEASELGAGFEIAMKDLEIRGAGDILGAQQSGAINTVGVSHFVRMLNAAVEDLKLGRNVEGKAPPQKVQSDVSLEIPLTALIPLTYISDTKEKIKTYQKLSAVDSMAELNEARREIIEEFGPPPLEFLNLLKVIRLKLACLQAGVTMIRIEDTGLRKQEAILALGEKIKPANILAALRSNPHWEISGDKLKTEVTNLGVDWLLGLQTTVEALKREAKD